MFDLTQNRHYSKKSKHNVKKHPHWRYEKEEDYLPWDKEIITGYVKNIKRYKSFQPTIKGERCECCGEKLSKQPWNRDWALCPKCSKQLETKVGVQRLIQYRETHLVRDITDDRVAIESNKRNAKITL